MRKLRVVWLVCALSCLAFAMLLPVNGAQANDVAALKAAERGQWGQARQLAGNSSVTRDLVQWMYLLDGSTRASFAEIAAFLAKKPDWPQAQTLARLAEGRMADDLSHDQIINWFTKTPPVSANGAVRYMQALLARQQTAMAVSFVKDWWVNASLTVDEQNHILNSYGRYLGTQDHIRRLERMMTDKQYSAARALAPKIGNGYPQLVEARVALQEGSKGVQAQVSRVPTGLLRDTGLMLSRAQWRRQNGENKGAIELLHAAPPAGQTTTPAAWWRERHIMARRMMEQNNWREAYRLAANHGLPAEGADFAAAEFLAGWLSLRKMGEPYKAFEHFERLYNGVSSPISKARGAYWAGRASEALKSRDIALQWYQVAARFQTTFYGQQAAERIGLPLTLAMNKPQVSSVQKDAFEGRDIVMAARLLHRAGLSSQRGQFLRGLLSDAKTPQDYVLLSDLSVSMGQVNMAIRVAKDAERQGLHLIDYLFPTISHTVRGGDGALVHALIRQESQFDANAVSSAGALGLMQVMPATARETAKKAGLRHETSWLTSRPEHNVQIGTYYIEEMLRRFNGNLPMAIAAYNAGPGRINQWINSFGDPRHAQVDTLDWIEMIPIYETRNYVHRVMEGYAVYKAKLSRMGGQGARVAASVAENVSDIGGGAVAAAPINVPVPMPSPVLGQVPLQTAANDNVAEMNSIVTQAGNGVVVPAKKPAYRR